MKRTATPANGASPGREGAESAPVSRESFLVQREAEEATQSTSPQRSTRPPSPTRSSQPGAEDGSRALEAREHGEHGVPPKGAGPRAESRAPALDAAEHRATTGRTTANDAAFRLTSPEPGGAHALGHAPGAQSMPRQKPGKSGKTPTPHGHALGRAPRGGLLRELHALPRTSGDAVSVRSSERAQALYSGLAASRRQLEQEQQRAFEEGVRASHSGTDCRCVVCRRPPRPDSEPWSRVPAQ